MFLEAGRWLATRFLGEPEIECEDAPPFRSHIDRDPSTMRIDNFFDDGKAKPGAS
jgi:hypothetical protein